MRATKKTEKVVRMPNQNAMDIMERTVITQP
jgi:hypothetical protein